MLHESHNKILAAKVKECIYIVYTSILCIYSIFLPNICEVKK